MASGKLGAVQTYRAAMVALTAAQIVISIIKLRS
jgi:hypothetical protein